MTLLYAYDWQGLISGSTRNRNFNSISSTNIEMECERASVSAVKGAKSVTVVNGIGFHDEMPYRKDDVSVV